MSTIEQDLKRQVNIKKVVKAVKNIGSFALYSKAKDCTLLITSHFILNLNEEQAWEMQCALLVKELGKWYTVVKGEPIEAGPVEDYEVEAYYDVVNDDKLNIIGFTELYLNNIALYTDNNSGYIGLARNHLEMLGHPLIKKSFDGVMVVASDYHVLSLAKDPECDYLRPLLF